MSRNNKAYFKGRDHDSPVIYRRMGDDYLSPAKKGQFHQL
jgi:hypothetical protein